MYGIRLTTEYKKGYKRMKKRGMDMSLLDEVVEKLQRGETLDEKYHDHLLKGSLTGFHECHIKPDWLLIYMIDNDILLLTLVDTGSHSDAFGM